MTSAVPTSLESESTLAEAVEWRPVPRHPLLHRVMVVALGFVALVPLAGGYGGPTGRVIAHVVLDGPVCQLPAHRPECLQIVNHGAFAFHGPAEARTAHDTWVRLSSANSVLTLDLEPGTYSGLFYLEPPYQALFTAAGGRAHLFSIEENRVTRVTIRPAHDFIIGGD